MTDMETLLPLAEEVLSACREKGLMIATAESCTGGLIAGILTEIAGSSDVFDRGFVTYSNDAKKDLLSVDEADLEAYGAVSQQVARQMASGALANSRGQIAVSVTGVAGPGGGSKEKPVGTVYFGLAVEGSQTIHKHCLFPDEGRGRIRTLSIKTALDLLLNAAHSVSAR
ncbi:CinA family protein [Roseibium aggregatum]|uniref:CinA family protein n=1 Tax=Roseibium aggregatum TaxID=187304 RepID=A0A926S3X8_9HYPH|nr:CinA family protein [Roseibium aggregatum]MBD1545768.1 CinA family protein [Roseibium aggregatum]